MSNDPKGMKPVQQPIAEDIGEDWQQDMKKKSETEEADPKLAGMYRVTHGELFFSNSKIVKAGRRVRLTAAEAKHFLELELIERAA